MRNRDPIAFLQRRSQALAQRSADLEKVYPVGVQLIWPITKVRGKPRKHHVPDILSIAAERMLASAKWKTVSWRSGTKGRLKARFAALRVRTADGPPQRIWDKGQQHLPGDEAWLIGEQRASGEKKYYLAKAPSALIKSAHLLERIGVAAIGGSCGLFVAEGLMRRGTEAIRLTVTRTLRCLPSNA
jgi:hypothetical protein